MVSDQCLHDRLISLMDDLVRIFDLYHNYAVIIESIMQFFVYCGQYILCNLSQV